MESLIIRIDADTQIGTGHIMLAWHWRNTGAAGILNEEIKVKVD